MAKNIRSSPARTRSTAPIAYGSHTDPTANGLLKVVGTAGETFAKIRLSSSTNSFEIDNLAVQSVPEASTWAMMLAGMGIVGFSMRRKRNVAVSFA